MEKIALRGLSGIPARAVTERDEAILRHIAANRFSTSRAIEAKFWAGKKNTIHYRRMRRLCDLGLVDVMVGDHGARLGYRLLPKGCELLKARGIVVDPSTVQGPRYRSTYDHDQVLIRVREIFESSRLVSGFVAEHELRALLEKRYGFLDKSDRHYKVPDGLFRLKAPRREFRAALELEIARKSKARYRHILKLLALSPDYDVTFFVIAEDSVRRVIGESLAEIKEKDVEMKLSGSRHGFYFIGLSALLDNGLDARMDGEGRSFSLREMEREGAAVQSRGDQSR